MSKQLFKGGHLTVKSGGLGPDDYLFRRQVKTASRWHIVIIRVLKGREMYDLDLMALSYIFQNCERTCLSDNQAITSAPERLGARLPVLSAWDFIHTYAEEEYVDWLKTHDWNKSRKTWVGRRFNLSEETKQAGYSLPKEWNHAEE